MLEHSSSGSCRIEDELGNRVPAKRHTRLTLHNPQDRTRYRQRSRDSPQRFQDLPREIYTQGEQTTLQPKASCWPCRDASESYPETALQVGERGLSDCSLEGCKPLLALKVLLTESIIRIQLLQHALPSALAALTGLNQLLADYPSILQAFTPSMQMLLGRALIHPVPHRENDPDQSWLITWLFPCGYGLAVRL